MIEVRPRMKKHFSSENSVADFMRIGRNVVRLVKNRCTRRFERNGQFFYIKTHSPAGWRHVLNELLHFRKPEVGARPEWLAIRKIQALEVRVPEIVAFGEEGLTPASRQSFLITKEIAPVISLEELFLHSDEKDVSPVMRRQLIQAVAEIARKLHTNGVNHRDFYLCHFLLEQSANLGDEFKLHLIDLHRTQIRNVTPKRWIIKDLGGLYFSALDFGLTTREKLLFVRCYTGLPIRIALSRQSRFWRAVENSAGRLYRKTHRRSLKSAAIIPADSQRRQQNSSSRDAA